MKPIPADEVINLPANTEGFVHVSVFLAQAFGIKAPPRATLPREANMMRGPRRADIAKCSGDELISCSTCMRHLSIDMGPEQQWTSPAIESGACRLYASQERYGLLYGTTGDLEA